MMTSAASKKDGVVILSRYAHSYVGQRLHVWGPTPERDARPPQAVRAAIIRSRSELSTRLTSDAYGILEIPGLMRCLHDELRINSVRVARRVGRVCRRGWRQALGLMYSLRCPMRAT